MGGAASMSSSQGAASGHAARAFARAAVPPAHDEVGLELSRRGVTRCASLETGLLTPGTCRGAARQQVAVRRRVAREAVERAVRVDTGRARTDGRGALAQASMGHAREVFEVGLHLGGEASEARSRAGLVAARHGIAADEIAAGVGREDGVACIATFLDRALATEVGVLDGLAHLIERIRAPHRARRLRSSRPARPRRLRSRGPARSCSSRTRDPRHRARSRSTP